MFSFVSCPALSAVHINVSSLQCTLQASDAELISATANLLRMAASAQQELKRLQQAQNDVHKSLARTTKESMISTDLQV
jgi:hypothetical protein